MRHNISGAGKTDTIAAIAAGGGNSGIGIIRVSGGNALEFVDRVYRLASGKKRLADVKSHTIHYGFIYDGDELVDEVMAVVMRAPNTYTREDTVEIDCHGGIFVMQRVLDAVLKNGCRLAEPGEFTKRAFLNGRIDLSKAEAVMDVIHSKNEFALKASINQLKGSVFNKVKALRADILHETAFIESALDDPEHISLDGYCERLGKKALLIKNEIKKMIDSAESGKLLKDGINTVIVGKPNVGKSSLLNLLAGEEKAIVTSIAGTTRDALSESVMLNGIMLNIIDTAGIRDTSDEVEMIGVEKAKKYADNADLIIYMTDASQKFDENDEQIVELIAGKKVIVLLNKADLRQALSDEEIYEFITQKIIKSHENNSLRIIKTSTKDNIGIDELGNAVRNMFFGGEISVNDEVYVTGRRHKEALLEAYESMELVLKSLSDNMPEDFYSIDLMGAYASLGKIIGEEAGDDLLDEIFSKFCMGK